jgi:hypothetical protein
VKSEGRGDAANGSKISGLIANHPPLSNERPSVAAESQSRAEEPKSRQFGLAEQLAESQRKVDKLFADCKRGEEMYIAMRNRCAGVEKELRDQAALLRDVADGMFHFMACEGGCKPAQDLLERLAQYRSTK